MSPITQELQQQTQQQQQQPPPPAHQLYPALHLYPVNNSFLPKQIALPPGDEHVIIGRQTDSMTVPGERNGYFDSKALNRRHAEVWEEDGKIFIRDVKSSNGTYINGERLSPEGVESDPFELRTDDILEFGIDIFEEDSQTIIHHKVAAKVHCVLGPEDLPLHALQNTTQDGLEQNSALGNAPGDPIKYPDSSSAPQNDSTQNPNAGRRPSMTSLAQSNPPDFRGVDASVSALQGDDNSAVRNAYIASLESEISSLRDEMAAVYKIQGQNAQRLLAMNETLREKEEVSRQGAEELRRTKEELETLKKKVDQHKEPMAEIDQSLTGLECEVCQRYREQLLQKEIQIRAVLDHNDHLSQELRKGSRLLPQLFSSRSKTNTATSTGTGIYESRPEYRGKTVYPSLEDLSTTRAGCCIIQ